MVIWQEHGEVKTYTAECNCALAHFGEEAAIPELKEVALNDQDP